MVGDTKTTLDLDNATGTPPASSILLDGKVWGRTPRETFEEGVDLYRGKVYQVLPKEIEWVKLL